MTLTTALPTEAEINQQIAPVNKSIEKAAKVKDKRKRHTTWRKLGESFRDRGPTWPVARIFRTDGGGDEAARGNRGTGRLSSNRKAPRIPTEFFLPSADFLEPSPFSPVRIVRVPCFAPAVDRAWHDSFGPIVGEVHFQALRFREEPAVPESP